MAISQYGNDYYGLSTDDKPTGTALNGRQFEEMDTSKKYRFDAENSEWLLQSGGGGGGSSTLTGLTDVDISNPTDGQTLVYDASTEKWVNESGPSGGVLVVNAVLNQDQTSLVLDHTYNEIKNAPFAIIKTTLIGNATYLYIGVISQSSTAYEIACVSVGQFSPDVGWAGIVFTTLDADGYPVYDIQMG